MARYIGRFAPSPTGALHAGSLVAALASWLDAKAHGGKWLVRIEDVDTPRCVFGADREILRQLAACGLIPDEEPLYQSRRGHLYQSALDRLIESQTAYPCACSRKDIEAVQNSNGASKLRHGELIYPGTCRTGLSGRPARAWRFNHVFFNENRQFARIEYAQIAIDLIANSSIVVDWEDRRLGAQQQDVSAHVGDFVLKRADGLWAYQLAVVVDDAAQGITHIVRGEDLADNTARQILLQQALLCPTPKYLHTALALASDGQKLSKQNGAQALAVDSRSAVNQAISAAALTLNLTMPTHRHEVQLSELLLHYVKQWRSCY